MGRDHVLQFAYVDDHGNVVLSAFVRAAAPGALLLGAWPGDLATEPLDEARFDDVAAMLCAGATLVAYQRVLQGGFCPGAPWARRRALIVRGGGAGSRQRGVAPGLRAEGGAEGGESRLQEPGASRATAR